LDARDRRSPAKDRKDRTRVGDLGLATAETSATVRFVQPESAWKLGLAMYALQPLPLPLHALSVQPREFEALTRLVPPTAITCALVAGYCGP
jgi:hypothetical protein